VSDAVKRKKFSLTTAIVSKKLDAIAEVRKGIIRIRIRLLISVHSVRVKNLIKLAVAVVAIAARTKLTHQKFRADWKNFYNQP
jgi:hypothetical protein